MKYELDHVFVCCAPGAPEAQRLVDLGLAEGSPNVVANDPKVIAAYLGVPDAA